jgi:hypothetical protein
MMLQVLYLDVSKEDWMLHKGCVWEAKIGTSGPGDAGPHGRTKSRRGWGRAGMGVECKRTWEANRPGSRYSLMDRYLIGHPDAKSSVTAWVLCLSKDLKSSVANLASIWTGHGLWHHLVDGI